LVAGILVLSWRSFRRAASTDRELAGPWLASAAAIVALLVGSKVLSMQYPLWLAALAPFLPGRARWLVLAVAALTTWIFTADYEGLWRLEPQPTVALLVRNGLLVLLLVALARQLARHARADDERVLARAAREGPASADRSRLGGRVGGSGDAPLSFPEPTESTQAAERVP
jgi:hypothetical protein